MGRLFSIAALSGVIAILPGTASAQQVTRNIDLGTFRPSVGTVAEFTALDGAHSEYTGSLVFGAIVHHAVNPLIIENAEISGMSDKPVSQRTATQLSASYVVAQDLEVSVAMPFMVQSGNEPMVSGIDPVSGFAVGDVALQGKYTVDVSSGLAVGLAFTATAPTATDGEFAGAPGFTAYSRGIVEYRLGPIVGLANMGFRAREKGRLGNVIQGHEVSYGVGVSYVHSERLSASAELFGARGVSGGDATAASPVEGIVAGRLRMSPSLGFVGGLGRGLNQAVGSPAVRGFLAVSYRPRITKRPAAITVSNVDPTLDPDGDGIVNLKDQCINEPEDMDGFEDEDGCPEYDNDGDGVADTIDKCPESKEDMDGYLDEDGCEDKDNDKDGILDVDDKCPDVPEDKDGFQDSDGCDDVDNDNDGVVDLIDRCPLKAETINGVTDGDGCPDRGRPAVVVRKKSIQIKKPIAFVRGRTRLRPSGVGVLDQLATHLRLRSDILKIHITVRAGSDKPLAELRAKKIVAELNKRGIAKERMKASGSSNRGTGAKIEIVKTSGN